MNLKLSAMIAAEKIMRHGLRALHFRQRTFCGIPCIDVHSPAHLAELVPKLARRVEGKVARAAARIHRGKRRIRRRKSSGPGVETKNENSIQAEIGYHNIAVVGR